MSCCTQQQLLAQASWGRLWLYSTCAFILFLEEKDRAWVEHDKSSQKKWIIKGNIQDKA